MINATSEPLTLAVSFPMPVNSNLVIGLRGSLVWKHTGIGARDENHLPSEVRDVIHAECAFARIHFFHYGECCHLELVQ